MDIRQFRKKIDEIMAGWSEAYKQAAEAVINRLSELLAAGYNVNQAVDMALKESAFFTAINDKLKDALLQAAAVGFGIDPAVISAPAKAIIIEKLNTLPWAPDYMPLSTRLHGVEIAMRQAIAETIDRQLRNGTNWVKLARQLYDGYGYEQIINRATLPKYLNELQRAARRTLAIDVNKPDRAAMAEYGRLIRQASRQIERLSQDSAPNKALKTAYKMLLDTAQDYSEKALDKAIEVAVNERSRYFAERISRTEIARAWADGFYARHQDDPNVIAYRWRLSSRHPKYDICDFHAKANLYGLGSGVYPKNSLPPQPAHPHCLCHWEEVFDGELDGMRQRDQVQKGGDDFLRKIDLADRRQLLGVKGSIAWSNGGSWPQYLRQWKGHEDPCPRLTKDDFEISLFAGKKSATMKLAMLDKAQQIRKQIIKKGPIWKPGKLEEHIETRKKRGHIPVDWTAEDYNKKILQILQDKDSEIYRYYKNNFPQNYFVYGLPNWVVIVGENGVMETAFMVDTMPYCDYLNEKDGYFKIGHVGSD